MVVYRTMANPMFVDPSLDPSGRDYGSLLSERPDLMNYAALGLARTVTPRAWLSTWSGLSTNANLVDNAARVHQPTLLVHAGNDREVHPSDVAAIAAAIGADDRTVVTIEGARHYFEPEPGEKEAPHVERLMDVVVPWITARFS
jgi:alpha-beta hydrolase superfamily lysophospholipase